MHAPRRELLTTVPGLDYAALIAFLETQSDVAAAYLFGSLAQGRAAPGSDIDLAVLLRPLDATVSLERRLQLIEGVERCAERRVDVVTLNDAPLLVRREVLRHGRLLYERDRAVRVEFEVRTGKLDADLAPMRAFFAQALFQEIRDGRFGHRRHRSGAINRIEE
ncbi:MAG: nucleotidyltransferase domain-containing protein [Roseiflexus sp.]|nr:nucleotidyltransferase domain-containing protein [Roseiflexus sp.]MCS7287831.1 nucleotidyltransferase domain-containing protein [Roseiflexus sp.]MDW8146995.1 nucleotidyltransferase domain-containing protein [Roseiflexaceae bacterium]